MHEPTTSYSQIVALVSYLSVALNFSRSLAGSYVSGTLTLECQFLIQCAYCLLCLFTVDEFA